MSKRTLRKLDGKWYFVSEVAGSNAVHDIATGSRVSSELRTRVLAEAKSTDLRGLWDPLDRTRPIGTIPRDGNWDVWRRLAQAIDDHKFDKITVPITPLRDLCKILRTIDPKGCARQLASSWLAAPEELARLFLRSVEDFEEYENDDRFEPVAHGEASAAPGSGRFAQEVASRATHAGSLAIAGIATPLAYVAHEISPRRTRGARLEGDDEDEDVIIRRHNKSGAGGLDLLLTDGSVFIVGELKAFGDTSLPFALVQGLMYAAELVSESQRRRLARSYQARLGFLEQHAGPFADVIVIFEASPSHAEDLARVSELATALLHGSHVDAKRLQRVIRRIVFVEGALAGSELNLRVAASSGPIPTA